MSLFLSDRACAKRKERSLPTNVNTQLDASSDATTPVALHSVARVRHSQGISLRAIASGWGMEISEVRRLENESTNLTIGQLLAWQEVLGVPIVELLAEDTTTALSPPVLGRARLIRMMKSVASVRKQTRDATIQRLVEMLSDELVNVMPELAEVGPWQGAEIAANDAADHYNPKVYRMPSEFSVGE